MAKTINTKTRNAIRRDYMNSPDRIMNQLRAMRKGKRTVITVENPDREDTKNRFIKVEGKNFFSPEELPKSTKKTVVAEVAND